MTSEGQSPLLLLRLSLFRFTETTELVIIFSKRIYTVVFHPKHGLNLITRAGEYLKICHYFGGRERGFICPPNQWFAERELPHFERGQAPNQ
jgi:hypothetical protein